MRCRLLLLALVPAMLISCSEDMKSNAMFRLKGCDGSVALEQETVKGSLVERDLMIRHETAYPCCADITTRLLEKEGVLEVFEENTAETCGCLCTYKVDTSLLNIAPGNYTLVLHGISHDGTLASMKNFSKNISVPGQESWEIISS